MLCVTPARDSPNHGMGNVCDVCVGVEGSPLRLCEGGVVSIEPRGSVGGGLNIGVGGLVNLAQGVMCEEHGPLRLKHPCGSE